jgi:superfamily II DNA/RNA helicase
MAATDLEPTFEAIGVTRDFLLSAIHYLKFQNPSQVQLKTIPLAIAGRDLIVRAESGSGKTYAFAFALLQRLVVS